MLQMAEFWVGIAFGAFVLILLYYRVPALIARTLDDRAAAIRKELDEARRLREEAQNLLADYQRRHRNAGQEAETIVEQARHEAEAFAAETRHVLLIDEIDKADLEFPNDLLLELDRMEFYVYETRRTIQARHRPIVVITSNNEKELPDAFLRRCFFHYIRFPDRETMLRIVDVHFPGLKHDLVHEALTIFFEIREMPGLKKKPSTSELLDWLKLLLVEDISPETLRTRDPAKLIPPLHGALLKNEQDVHLFERLAFLHRRERG
jgi:MoxR-like ATPase